MYAPDYQKDFNLYLAAADMTIAMVLVQEDNGIEHPIYYLNRNLNDTEIKYSYVEKLALAAVQAIQKFRHYVLFKKTTILSDCNPMTYILSRQLLGGKYSKWIEILQEFDLELKKSKSKRALVFTELLCDLPSSSNDATSEEAIVDENLFLISSSDPWYGDIIIYLQTQAYTSNTSRSEQQRIRYQSKDYVIVGDTLYHRGIDTVLRRCLTHEEAEKVLNDCHLGACGGHQYGYATAHKILRAGYFWPTMFKYCITAVRSCNACQIFNSKTRKPPTLLQPVVVVRPFTKWGIDFITCNPTSAGGHGYIIVVVDYFTKWAEVMPTLNNNGKTAAILFFNHVVSRFGIPQAIVTDHGSHFRNHMMVELAAKLGLSHDSSTLYYPQAIRQTSVRNATGFTPFQLVYRLEAIPPVQCEISSLKLTVDLLPGTSEEEARFLELIQLDETRRDVASANEAHKKQVKAQFDKNVKPRVFSEGDLVLLYDQESDKLGAGKFKSLWMGPYIVKRVLAKGAYELIDYDGIPLAQPRNGLYLKCYYA
eukprot:PITA_35673